MMKKTFMMMALAVASLGLSACGGSKNNADQRQAAATAKMTDEADRAVGMPAIANFTEKKLARDIYELRDDPNLVTYAYVQGMDGKLHCLGMAQGYGLPYSTQFSNPERITQRYAGGSYWQMPQAEPNGLFIPEGLSATWLKLVDPETGDPKVVYVEPTITVSPVKLRGPAVASPC